MSFYGDEGEFISLTAAATLTYNYRSASTSSTTVLGHFLGKGKLEELLGQTGCVGLRIYHGINGSTGSPEIVVVGVDSDENDILGTSPLILDTALPCPSNCSNANDLNS